MKTKSIRLNNFKRFTNCTIENIPDDAKLVIVVGTNGAGKSSLFDSFLWWYKSKGGFGTQGSDFELKDTQQAGNANGLVHLDFYDFDPQDNHNQREFRSRFYFRNANRLSTDFNVKQIEAPQDPLQKNRFNRFIDQDSSSVRDNYQRLIYNTVQGLYQQANNRLSVEKLRERLIGKLRESMGRVFDDLVLKSISDPLQDGALFFEKGQAKSFHYKNLSGGEKSAFDLLFDYIMKLEHHPNAIYCIDEPEMHMHSDLQATLLKELYDLTPNAGQLWITTHSMGIIAQGIRLSREGQSVAFINLDGHDFDLPCTIRPSLVNKALIERLVSLTISSFVDLSQPNRIFICEGNPNGRSRRDFDSDIYSRIFENHQNAPLFVSGGSSTDILNENFIGQSLIQAVSPSSNVLKLVDRDDLSPQEILELENSGVIVLSRRHLESYLFDDEILTKLANEQGQDEVGPQIIAEKNAIMSRRHTNDNKAPDDVKSSAGMTMTYIKSTLSLTNCGSSVEAFMRDTLCPLVTPETQVYQELELTLFGN